MTNLKSMTAYGRSSHSSSIGTIEVEIQSLNRKNLDVRVYCASELKRFEINIQKWAAHWVTRGQLTVKIHALYEKESPVSVQPNLPLAREIKRAGDMIAEDLLIQDPNFSTRLLGRHDGLLVFTEDWGDESVYIEALKTAFDQAAEEFVVMKSLEGTHLAEDIQSRIHLLETSINKIEKACEGSVEKRKAKLLDLIEAAQDDEALLREVAFYADKVDIQEELTRFRSHLKQFLQCIEAGGAVGKKMDFIVQELFREITTIASKSAEIEVKQLTIEVRGEIERIREQIQNIE